MHIYLHCHQRKNCEPPLAERASATQARKKTEYLPCNKSVHLQDC